MNIIRDGGKNSRRGGKRDIFSLWIIIFAKILAADQSVLTLCPRGTDCPATEESCSLLFFFRLYDIKMAIMKATEGGLGM